MDLARNPALASFGVHVSVGLSASGLAATSVMLAGLASPLEMLALFGLGSLGSLLPDLDSDNSTPVQAGFTVASMLLAFGALFLFADLFRSVAELAAVWLGTYLLFRWAVFALFTRLTTHRGVFHSVPAALLFGLATAILGERGLGLSPAQCWLGGAFVSLGYLVHLALDEIYSVNLFGMRARRSLGSALKLWSPGSHAASLYLYAALALAWIAAPDPAPFMRLAGDPATYRTLTERLLPREGWFDSRAAPAPALAQGHPPGK